MLNIGSLNRMFRSFKQIKILISQLLIQQKQVLPSSLRPYLKQGLSLMMTVAVSAIFCGVIILTGCVDSVYAANLSSPESVSSTAVTPALADGAEIAVEKSDQFATAYLKVLELLSDREAEIPAAQTNAEAIEIEQSIEQDAVAIIQDSGLSMPEYMQILELASQDNAFQDKLLGRMDETGEAMP